MEIIIDRSTRMPTLLNGARSYKIVCKMDGVYILLLGKATLNVKNANPLSQAIAQGILDKLEDKYEQKRLEKEKEIINSNIKEVVLKKGNIYMAKESIKNFSTRKSSNGFLLLKIKDNKNSLELHIHPYYEASLDNMKRMMGF